MNDEVVQQVHYGKHSEQDKEHKPPMYDLDSIEQFGDLVNPLTKDNAPQVTCKNALEPGVHHEYFVVVVDCNIHN